VKPEDIRKLYASEDAADLDEARATEQELRTDPEQARRLLLTFYSLAGDDREIDQLLQLVLKAGTMQLLAQAAASDDTFALRMAELILDGMQQLAEARQRTPRGRQAGKKVKSA